MPKWCTARGRASGFTLIELMIVVAIVAILALVAYPSYTRYVVKANRGEAQSYLMEAAQRQQQYFMDERSYATQAQLGLEVPARVAEYYDVSFPEANEMVGPPPTFTLTATPVEGTIQDGDGVLTINQAGIKLKGSEPW